MKRYLYLISLFFIITSVNAQCNNYTQSIIGDDLLVTPVGQYSNDIVGTITITGSTFNLTLNNSIAWVFTSGNNYSIKMGNALKINVPCPIPFLYLGYLKNSYGSSTVSASIQDNYIYFNCDSGSTCTSLYGMNVSFTVNIPLTNWFPDADNDTYGSSSASPTISWYKPIGYYAMNNLDCNDSDANLNPQTKWYQDIDRDNFGDANNLISSCTKPIGPIEYIRNRPFDECPTIANTNNFGCPLGANPTVQTTSENYITITEPLIAVSNISNITDNRQKKQVTQYFDGLGRPKQTILIRASPSGKDIITHYEYDVVGRQSKEFLPYPSEQASGKFSSSASNDVLTYYNKPYYQNTLNPYGQKSLESSPLNRVLKQAAPGSEWALGLGHEIKFDYQTNTTADAVKLFTVTANWDISKGLYDIAIPTGLTSADYQQFQLYKTITYDENTAASPTESNGSTVEFKNKEGQVVLKRTYDAGVKHDIYYVYDQCGNLTFVIPPLVNATTTISNTILNDLCYQYKYDLRNRLVEKKLPGKQWEFIVYDKLDRVVATGPAFSPFSDITTAGWLITKYDDLNRVAYTGWENTIATSSTRTSKQTAQNGLTTLLNEYKAAPGFIDGVNSYYSNVVAPTAIKLLTVNYYDNYDFSNVPTFPAYSYNGVPSFYNNSTMKPKGMPTGSWVRVVTTSSSLAAETNYVLYDFKARPIRNYTTNYLGGFTRTDTTLDFVGKTTTTYTTHKRSTIATDLTITINESFTYSPQDRLLTHNHQINNVAVQLLAKNEYDELGQLIVKRVGGTDITGISPLQKIDYSYNIRGWITEINKVAALQQGSDPKDLFGFKINYNTINGFAGATKALYNGNIVETLWSNNADGGIVRAYGYLYDNLNRLKDATYYKTGSLPYVSKAYDENLTYDKNGNINTLQRNGGSDVSAPPNLPLDDLIYTYSTNSNKLLNVLDNSNNNAAGFVDTNKTGDDFIYDLNGNMITDKNKNITAIVYNHLNLPTKITFGTIGRIEYIYNANGTKLEKRVFLTTQGSVPVINYYLDGFQYIFRENYADYFTKLRFIPTSEGYVDFLKNSYVFNYTDHLGNVRVSYEKDATTGSLKILEESNYYPFGLKHSPSAVLNAQPTYKYKYNGKELQDELGLNMYDYGARNYDPAIGRWINIDPLAERHPEISPFVYCANNPIKFIDPNGKDWVEASNGDITWRKDVNSKNHSKTLKEGEIYRGKSYERIKDWNGVINSSGNTVNNLVLEDYGKNKKMTYSELESANVSVEGSMREGNSKLGDVEVKINLTFANGKTRFVDQAYSAVAGGFGNGAPENGNYTISNYQDRSPKGWYNKGMNNNGVGFSFNLNPSFSTGRTDLRIHPDGNNEGTLGCIGMSGSAIQLNGFVRNLNSVLKYQTSVPATLDIAGNPNNNGRSGAKIPNVNE